MKHRTIRGFSKKTKLGKIKWIVDNFFKDPETVMQELKSYWLDNEEQQKILDGFSENTISNYPLPYGVAPNFLLNGDTMCIPMVTEESSVVAAASSAAKFWMDRGGFHAEVINSEKVGHIHFKWKGNAQNLKNQIIAIEKAIRESTNELTHRMRKRGGGINRIELRDLTDQMDHYYQLMFFFDTKDSMGANFINSVLEASAKRFQAYISEDSGFEDAASEVDIIMSILSNYTPNCLVKTWVNCPIEDLGIFSNGMDAQTFAERFTQAVKIAKIDPYRATTHNKGIFNGIDSVVIATANDFRAVESAGHAFAAKDGQYRGLSDCCLDNDQFYFSMEIPIAIGTVGGLTSLHPFAKHSLELLGNPDAEELMCIIAAAGLAQNFAAIRSLVTTGIQKGHMRMHLTNILIQLKASEKEERAAEKYFEKEPISFATVHAFLEGLRQ